jgi:hypothetical protein
MNIVQRAHEWLADHVSWVQYPRITPMRRVSFFKTQMPWPTRVALVLFGSTTLVICAIALFFLGLLFWAALTA